MQQMGTGCFSVYARKMLIDGYVIRVDYNDVKAKTDDKLLVSSFGCAVETVDLEFEKTRLLAVQKGNNLAHHLIQAFEPGEVSYAQAHEIGRQLADEILGGKYEYVIATHINKEHCHNHIIFCAVDFAEHKKYISNRKSYAQNPVPQPWAGKSLVTSLTFTHYYQAI